MEGACNTNQAWTIPFSEKGIAMSALYHDSPVPTTKVCVNCNTEKPLSEFEQGRNSCKLCRKLQSKQRILNRKKNIIEAPLFSVKVCAMCHIEKPVEAFGKDCTTPTGYKYTCKDCTKAERDKRPKPKRPVVQRTFEWFKTCRVCNIEKPFDAFEPRVLVCMECRNAARRVHAYARDLAQESIPEDTQQCSECKKLLPYSAFYRNRYRGSGFSGVCKECDDKRKQQWNHDNAEHVRERKKQYKREKMPDYQRGYWIRNQERLREYHHQYYEANKEKGKVQRKEWQQAHLLSCRESNDRRRAHKQGTRTGRVNYKRILERDGYHCYICEDVVTPDQVSFDHKTPLSRGGTHTENNIKVAHKICNFRKGTRLLEEMTPYQRRGVR